MALVRSPGDREVAGRNAGSCHDRRHRPGQGLAIVADDDHGDIEVVNEILEQIQAITVQVVGWLIQG